MKYEFDMPIFLELNYMKQKILVNKNDNEQGERKDNGKHRKARTLKERTRTKVVQSKLYEEDYNRFLQINEARGMNTSAVIAMLITDYIRDNDNLLK